MKRRNALQTYTNVHCSNDANWLMSNALNRRTQYSTLLHNSRSKQFQLNSGQRFREHVCNVIFRWNILWLDETFLYTSTYIQLRKSTMLQLTVSWTSMKLMN